VQSALLPLTAFRTLEMARKYAKADVINYEEVSAGDALNEMTAMAQIA